MITPRTIAATIAAATIMLSGSNICAQSSQKLTAGKDNEYGLIYSLPLTAIDICIEAELTEEAPGEFFNYAKRHLGISDAITKENRRATLRSVTFIPRGIADSDNRWTAQFKSGSTPFMILDGRGIPLAINTESIPDDDTPELPQAKAAEPTPLQTEAARQAVTQDMARSSSTSKRAELAAQRIFELREMRSDIISGQADNTPPDGKAMQLVLDNITAQESALTAMFAGTRSTSTAVETITFVPDSAEVSGKVIARLSAVEGIVAADNLAGAPITLDLTILDEGTLPVNEKGEEKRFPKGGVAYNIPGKAHVTISYGGREIASADIELAQLGVTFGLDPALFTDKKNPAKLIFAPATGAIRLLGPAD